MSEFICRSFNTIDISNNILIKKAKNSYGAEIIKKEINLYNFISTNEIPFKTPCLYSLKNNEIHMEYMKDYIPLYLYLEQTKNFKIIENVRQSLNVLHNSKTITLSKEGYTKQVRLETVEKIIKRISMISSQLIAFEHINIVNGLRIQPFDKYIKKLEYYILQWIETQDNYTFNPIHGDPNFSNILIQPDSQDIVFIDPRGFFGDYLIYGPIIYDSIKLLFGLSGYDNFNTDKNTEYILETSEIKFEINPLTEIFNKKHNIETILMISIWMGLPQYLENDYNKMIISFFHSMYLAEKYF